MKKTLYTILMFAVIGGIAYADYYIYEQKQPCKNPISYKIGIVDPRFSVSSDAFKNDIAQASSVWSKAAGKSLFQYSPTGSLVINLIYDTRQQTTQKEKVLNAIIDQNSQAAQTIKDQYLALEDTYQTAEADYANQVAEYDQAQAQYNSEVTHWNSLGGAPKSEYAKMTAEKNVLTVQHDSLEQSRLQVNSLANQINAFIAKYNLLVKDINSDVQTINTDGLAGTEFEEGVYIYDNEGTRINIYQFENKTDLIRVLAHELGHALNLVHNQNPDSIMNPVNQGTNLSLSADDFAELQAECSLSIK